MTEKCKYQFNLYLELCPRCIHISYHGAHISDNGGKDENANQKVYNHKQVLHILLRLWCLPNGGEGEGGPVEAVTLERERSCIHINLLGLQNMRESVIRSTL